MVAKLSPGTFYGQTPRPCAVAGFTFAESVYKPDSQLHLPLHTHENAFLYLVIEGVCEETYGKGTRTVSPSTLAFHPAGEPHSNRWHRSGGRVFHIDISQARLNAIREYAPIQIAPSEFRCGVAPWLASRLYREYQRLDQFSPLAMEGLALEILAEASRHVPNPERTPPLWLLRARDLLQSRYAESLSLGEIALEVGIHPVHLARVFRHYFGCSPGAFLRRQRVDSACRQLASSNTPLIEIALSVGFADQSHFTKTFRRVTKMTPGEFRQHFRLR